jgi:archaemetzincin
MKKSWSGFISLKTEGNPSEMIIPALILSLSFLLSSNTDLLAKERDHSMGIILVPIGEVDKKVIEVLKNDLKKALNRQIFIGKEMPEPHYAFNKQRRQYLSTSILMALMKQKEYSTYEKILGIVDHDLYVPDLNFVFGEASQKAAVISITRLRQEFYNLPQEQTLFYRRALTEAVHELGHTYGLGHCGSPRCVMFFSNSLMDTDRKGLEFCPKCGGKLNKER